MMPESFRKLKPILGSRIDDLWRRYSLGDPIERQAIDEYITIATFRYLDPRIGDERIVLEPPPASVIGGGPIHVGSIEYPSTLPYAFTLYPEELLQHVFILGASGGGKTTFLLGILQQVTCPWAALDWKRNYRALLHHHAMQDLLVFTVGNDVAPLRVNMLRPPRGVSMHSWVEAVCDCICASWLLLAGARKMIKDAFLEAITAHGEHTTLRDAVPYLRLRFVKARFREAGWIESANRAIDELTTGPFGDALNATRNAMSMDDLLSRRVVFELEGLGYDQGKTFSMFYLQTIKLTRKQQSLPKEVLHHLTLADEAHNIWTKERRGDPPSVQSTVVKELREGGESFLFSTQMTDISESIIANSKTTICFNTRFPYDTKLMSDLLGVKQEYLPKIPVGQGIARLGTRWGSPFLFSFPKQPIKNQIVTDAMVRERYQAWARIEPDISTPIQHVREKEVTLLLDIAQYPISTVTQRYERLGWNPNAGTTIKNNLLRRGLTTFETVDDGSIHMKFLTLTPAGEELVVEHGGTIKPRGPGGMEHEFWRSRLRERCETRGYEVTEEFHLGDRRRVDLCAKKNGRTILIEIETGKSDVERNITKAAGHGQLVVFFTNNRSYLANQSSIPDGVLALTPETIKTLHTLLN